MRTLIPPQGTGAHARLDVPEAMVTTALAVLRTTLGLEPHGRLALVYHRDSVRLARAFELAARDLDLRLCPAALDPDADPSTEVARGIDAIADAEASVIILPEPPRPGTRLFDVTTYAPTRKRALLFGMVESRFGDIFAADVSALEAASFAIVRALSRGTNLCLVGATGQRLAAKLVGPLRATLETGRARPDRPTALLPAGFVEVQGPFLSGTCVVGGGVLLGGARVGATEPLTLEVADGRITAVHGHEAERVTAHFDAHPATRRISHIGFGINARIAGPQGTMQDLLMPGVYLVLGAHPARPTWQSPDAIRVRLANASVTIDGRAIPLLGRDGAHD